MTERPLHQYWPLFIGFPLFLGFALYNIYNAFAYGGLVGSGLSEGNGWVTFHDRPYRFSFALIVYLLMAVIFGLGLVRVVQFVLYRKGLLGRRQKRVD
jgi:hypothetical protein